MNNGTGKGDFKKLRVKRLPRAPVRETAEHRYWGNLKASLTSTAQRERKHRSLPFCKIGCRAPYWCDTWDQ